MTKKTWPYLQQIFEGTVLSAFTENEILRKNFEKIAKINSVIFSKTELCNNGLHHLKN